MQTDSDIIRSIKWMKYRSVQLGCCDAVSPAVVQTDLIKQKREPKAKTSHVETIVLQVVFHLWILCGTLFSCWICILPQRCDLVGSQSDDS